MTIDILPAPRCLIDTAATADRHGGARIALLAAMLRTADPLADAVVAEIAALGSVARAALHTGLAAGLAAVPGAPPAVVALLHDAETLPDWVEPERLRRGMLARLMPGEFWINASLGPGSLVHTYSSPAIARVLVGTGELVHMADRRLIETAVWNIETALPGGLLRGAAGYTATLQVRLMHARVRAGLWRRGHDTDTWGAPINQVELLRTWFDFTYVPIRALGNFGIHFTSSEIGDLYHLWHYIAHLLGVAPALYRQIVDQASAAAWLDLINSTSAPADANSKLLVDALLTSYGSQLVAPTLRIKPAQGIAVAHAFARHLHGDTIADTLDIRRVPVRHLFPLIIAATRAQQAWQRRVPGGIERAAAATVATFRSQLAAVDWAPAYTS